MSQIPTAVAPSSRSWLGIGRELATGSPVNPTNTIPLDKSTYEPEDMIKYLEDLAIRGYMSHRYADVEGVTDASFSYGSPYFGDVWGFFFDNLFGDMSTVGSNGTSSTTTTQALSAGATSGSVSSLTGYTNSSIVQIGTGSIAEVVILNASGGTTGSSINFSNYPLRFAHGSGSSVQVVSGPYCVDAETEILTENGWATVDTVKAGDSVLTYNHATGMSEWQEAQEICVFPAEPRELILMEGRGHSSLTTPNHRWPVVTRYGQRQWKTTETLKDGSRIPVAAFCADLPKEAKYADAFVELIAWFWTEGTIRESGSVRICQSHVMNASNVERIDMACRSVFGEPSDLLGRSPSPRWRRYTDGRNVRFALNAAAGKILQEEAPRRVVRREFLRALTQAQLDLFIQVSMLGDNCGPTRLGQKDREAAEAFQFAATLAGYATSLLERVYKRDGYSMWQVTLQNRKWITPVASQRMAARYGAGWAIKRITHDGLVWCPRTPNQTWFARRHGSCYFTGNTHTFAVLNQTAGYNGIPGAQGPTHTVTDTTYLTPTVNARAYPSLVVGQIDITGNAEGLLMAKVSGNSWLSAPAGTAPVNTTTFIPPLAAWQTTITVGGTSTFSNGEFSASMKRELGIMWTAQGAQNPYIIARGDLDATGSQKFTVPSDETALNLFLQNVQPSVSFTTTNGLSGTAGISLTLSTHGADYVKSKPTRSGVLIGYDDEWRTHANTTDVGGSGGMGQITAVLINNVPTY